MLKKIIVEGYPDSLKEFYPDVQVYFPFRDELVVQNGIIYNACKLLYRDLFHIVLCNVYITLILVNMTVFAIPRTMSTGFYMLKDIET